MLSIISENNPNDCTLLKIKIIQIVLKKVLAGGDFSVMP